MAVSYGVLSGVKGRIASASQSFMPKLVLFDIDGTLVLTGGAGIRALNRAGEAVLGIPSMIDGIQVAGRTDWVILHDAVRKHGRRLDDDLLARLRREYLADLHEEILRPG